MCQTRSILAPFFYYRDFALEADNDPYTPLAPMAKVPTFPSKIYSILAHEEYSDIIQWMPHGRSWKILDARKFEANILPVFFDHSKITSFVRQANGWGFRRITKGADRDSYYHEFFLRGLPHLCKRMRRPGVSEKLQIDAEHEPDLWAISRISPVPENELSPDVEAILECTLTGGPKARMPVVNCGNENKRSMIDFASSIPENECGRVDTHDGFSKQDNRNAATVPPLVAHLNSLPSCSLNSGFILRGQSVAIVSPLASDQHPSCGVDDSLLDSLMLLRKAQKSQNSPIENAFSCYEATKPQVCYSDISSSKRANIPGSESTSVATQIRVYESVLVDQQSHRTSESSQVVKELLAQLFLVTHLDINAPTM